MLRAVAVALAVLLLPACRDAGDEAYDTARARHRALVLAEEHPASPRFDEVLQQLAKVPPGHRHATDARRLENAINSARSLIRAPLAVLPGDGGQDPEVAAQMHVCARLAELIGQDGGMNPRTLQALDDCRLKAEKLMAHHHPKEPHLETQ